VRGERKDISSYPLSRIRWQGDAEKTLAQKPGESRRAEVLISGPQLVQLRVHHNIWFRCLARRKLVMINHDREDPLFIQSLDLALIRCSTIEGDDHVRLKVFDPYQDGVTEPIAIKDTIGLYDGTVRAERVERSLHNRRRAISIGVVIGDNNDMPPLKNSRVDIEGR
jgi:hypothetical protein